MNPGRYGCRFDELAIGSYFITSVVDAATRRSSYRKEHTDSGFCLRHRELVKIRGRIRVVDYTDDLTLCWGGDACGVPRFYYKAGDRIVLTAKTASPGLRATVVDYNGSYSPGRGYLLRTDDGRATNLPCCLIRHLDPLSQLAEAAL